MAVEARIDDDLVIYATTGGPRFSTTIAATKAGFEKRNCDWVFPLGQWNIGERQVLHSDMARLQAFFMARKGKFEAFRFKDWGDYLADATNSTLIAVAPGTYQLYKTYGSTRRRITKPAPSTVRVFDAAGQELGAVVDYATGQVACSSPPASWEGEFDVPVRFDSDSFSRRFDHLDRESGKAVFYVSAIPLVEVME